MSRIIQIGIAVGLLLIPSVAFAGNYQACFQVEIQTVDSGFDIPFGPDAGLSEDHWTSCDGGCNVIARGVHVTISKGGWSQSYDADPLTGCFDWTHNDSSGFTFKVWGFSTNSEGTFVRIHDGVYNDTSTYPGTTYSYMLYNQSATHGASNTYYVGDYSPEWTTFASLAFGLMRYPYSNANKEIHVAFDRRGSYAECGADAPCCTSSTAHGTGAITSGRHYIFIGDADSDCPSTHSTRKFVVTHELGHALLRLSTNTNGGDPNVSATHNEDGSANPDNCDTGPDGSYTMSSKEWNSLGFREGFAHFIAARIWNERSQSGAFTWTNGIQDLERYGQGAGNSSGGRLENECCTSGCSASWPNAGTNEDWLRFFWDFYNNESVSCPDVPDSIDMLDLYGQVRSNGGLTSTNYFSKLETAVTQIGLDACLSGARFDAYAALNGIDN